MNKTKESFKEPLVVNCEEKKKVLYDEILKRDLFAGQALHKVFIMAMSIGFNKDRRAPLSKKKDIIRTESFTEEQKNMIKSLAVAAEDTLEILINKKKVYSIVEEYANGGIDILYNIFFGKEYGSPDKKIENDLEEIASDILKKK